MAGSLVSWLVFENRSRRRRNRRAVLPLSWWALPLLDALDHEDVMEVGVVAPSRYRRSIHTLGQSFPLPPCGDLRGQSRVRRVGYACLAKHVPTTGGDFASVRTDAAFQRPSRKRPARMSAWSLVSKSAIDNRVPYGRRARRES